MAMNITEIRFGSGKSASGYHLYQYDYGQRLVFPDLDLPEAYEVHFASDGDAQTITMIGNADGVLIPDQLLQSPGHLKVYIYLHEGEDDGATKYCVTIPIKPRPKPSDDPPTEHEQTAIEQAITALNTAVDVAEGYATDAGQSATSASDSATEAQSWARSASDSATASAQSAQSALDSANRASASEASASASAQSAQQSATSASASAQSAKDDADRAEQASANAGYMFFYIDSNGDLIYQRTSNTQVDFYLSEGDLYVEARV